MTQSITPELRALAILAESETALHRLYAGYAEILPELGEFWARLAKEETTHAAWVNALSERLQAGELAFRDGRLVPQIFETFLGYVNERIAEITSAPPSLFSALSIARDIEDTIVEKHYYDVLEGDSPASRQLLAILGKTAHEHAERVRAMWEQHRPKSDR